MSETEPAPIETPAVTGETSATPSASETAPVEVAAMLPVARERALGALLMLIGYGGAFLLMANANQVFRGPFYGILLCVLGTVGFVSLIDGRATGRVTPLAYSAFGKKPDEPIFMAPIVTVPLALALSVGILMALRGEHGFDAAAAIAVLAGLAPLLLSAYRRPTLLLTVIVTGIYLPRLGAYPLWDPWETHYGEVAREMLSRDDWISLWWAQENWFFSKPIFIFWAEALSMGSFGYAAGPDANSPDPEWCLRLPIFLLSLLAVLAANALARRIAGARAGVLAGLVVASMPLFFMISHQAITDMPVVSCMTIALCMLGLAVTEDKDAIIGSYALGPFRWSSRRNALALLAMVGVPQILYLLSRNVRLDAHGLTTHNEMILYGSAGNDGVPGNAILNEIPPVYTLELGRIAPGSGFARTLEAMGLGHIDLLAPASQALWWIAALAIVIRLVRRDDKRQAPLMVGFYVLCALGFLAKGIPGFALPGLVALFFLIAAGRFRALFEGELRVTAGIVIVLALGLPWYVAMHIRHGVAFIDRILVHDHLNRLASGVHGDTGSLEYFIGQLGYGAFPWVGLAPAAVFAFLWYKRSTSPNEERDTTRDGIVLVSMWALSSFTLFSAMVTKFHHYIFPVIPPVGILVGITLDKLFQSSRTRGHEALVSVISVVSGALLAIAIGGAYGNLRGIAPSSVAENAQPEWVLAHAPPVWVLGLLFGLAVLGFVAAYFIGAYFDGRAKETSELAPAGFALVGFAGAALVAMVGRDLSWATAARPAGYERLANLYTYKYDRTWPTHIDYRPFLTGLAIAATIALVALAWPKLRGLGARALLGVALLFAAFGVNVYLPDVAPHWSSGRLVARYYHQRKNRDEPLLAYQMNWKGENFYTGNHAYVFQDINTAAITEWMAKNERQSFFAILEHGRISGFRAACGIRRVVEHSTMRDNNKFVLVHVTAARP